MPLRNRRDLLAQVEASVTAKKEQIELANAKLTARAGRNIVAAVGTGLGFAGIVALALFVVPELLLLLTLVVGGGALYELATAFRKAGRRVPRTGVVLGGSAIVLLTWFYREDGALLGLFLGTMILLFWRLLEWLLPQFHVGKRSLVADLAAGIFTMAYIPFMLSLAVLLLHIPEKGTWWVFVLLLLPIANDTGAYIFGMKFGKHKMAPRISPNKTWEGFIGAGFVVCAVAIVAGVFLLELPLWLCLIMGMLVLCTATAGDLIESLIKRNLGVKDMSSLIPGHGGLLDRLDSILPSTVPVFAAAVWQGVL